VGDTVAHNSDVLNVTALTSSAIALGASQTLAGFGTATGAVAGSATGTVAPGKGVGQQIGGMDTRPSNQLTNGSTFTAAGFSFTINYGASVSGTNDVSLTAVSVPCSG
jgi:hypothetical protein